MGKILLTLLLAIVALLTFKSLLSNPFPFEDDAKRNDVAGAHGSLRAAACTYRNRKPCSAMAKRHAAPRINVCGANPRSTSWPASCGSNDVRVDRRIDAPLAGCPNASRHVALACGHGMALATIFCRYRIVVAVILAVFIGVW